MLPNPQKMMMDAQKTVQFTMQEIKEMRLSLQQQMDVLKQHEDQKGNENKLEIIERLLKKLEQ